MKQKLNVGVLFGGKSAEHEISLLSARSIIEAMDPEKYEIVLIGISKLGEWFLYENLESCLAQADSAKHVSLRETNQSVALAPKASGDSLVSLTSSSINKKLEVIFPVLHGTFGEDGTIQGLLKLANIPFVGAGVLSSAACMDKDVMKRLLRDKNIPIAKFITFHRSMRHSIDFKQIEQDLGLPLFIKPANLGSSIGISKVKNEDEFYAKLDFAFEYDRKVIIESFIAGREIECSVLGNEYPIASLPGELIPQHEFYSYEAKYLDKNGALFEIPAKLNETDIQRIQELAVRAYTCLGCEGMARVDLFLQNDGQLILNEVNTIPGFTKISMYPKMWEASGLPYSKLIDKLIDLALERFKEEQSIKTVCDLVGLDSQPVAIDL